MIHKEKHTLNQSYSHYLWGVREQTLNQKFDLYVNGPIYMRARA